MGLEWGVRPVPTQPVQCAVPRPCSSVHWVLAWAVGSEGQRRGGTSHIQMDRPQMVPRCTDCGAVIRQEDSGSLSGWWVVNVGALVCDQCSSCHRSLGRHVSTVQRVPDAAIAAVVEVISKEVRLPRCHSPTHLLPPPPPPPKPPPTTTTTNHHYHHHHH
jgi:hypothetical protein